MPTHAFKTAKYNAELMKTKLSGTDPRFSYTTHIVMNDGSVFITANSFITKFTTNGDNSFLFVFSEHYDPMVLDVDEVDHYGQYKRQVINNESD